MTIHTPQMLWILVMGVALGIQLAIDGKPKTGKHSFFCAAIAVVIESALLYWGGFFG